MTTKFRMFECGATITEIACEIRRDIDERACGDEEVYAALLADLDVHAEVQRYGLTLAEATDSYRDIKEML